jgi:hypothetical protein
VSAKLYPAFVLSGTAKSENISNSLQSSKPADNNIL